MKKVIISLLTISYLVISFVYLQVFSVRELESIYIEGVKAINVNEGGTDVSTVEKLKQIEKLSKSKGINIYKVIYDELTDSNEIIVDIYTALADENKLRDKFKIKYEDSIENLFLNNGYLSSENKEIGVFNRNLNIRIKSLSEAINENIIGQYLIQTDDLRELESIKQEFTEILNLGLADEIVSSNIDKNNILSIVELKYLILIAILLISILLAFIYYIVFRYKEFAIKKMFGHSDGKIIFKDVFKEILTMHLYTLVASGLIVMLYLYYYNKFKYVVGYLKNLSIVLLVFSIILIVVEMVISLNIDNIKIKNMLNNKKPITLIQSLNYITKVTFSIVLVAIMVNLISNYNNLISQNKNLEKWKSTNEYVYFNMTDKYRDSEELIWNYNQSLRCRELFKYYNNKGGLLVSPSNYFSYNNFYGKESLNTRKEYDPIDGIALEVNAEYLRQNPIRDTNGNIISIEDEYGDYLIILVPEKYKEDEENLLQLYKEIYQFRRFVNEDIYNEYMNIEKVDHPEIKIKIIYTENGQESFLYNPLLEEENQNSIIDSVHIVINSENIGGDSYTKYVSSNEFFAKIDGSVEGDAYSKVYEVIKELDMEKDILSAYTLYSNVDSYIIKVEMKLKNILFL